MIKVEILTSKNVLLHFFFKSMFTEEVKICSSPNWDKVKIMKSHFYVVGFLTYSNFDQSKIKQKTKWPNFYLGS